MGNFRMALIQMHCTPGDVRKNVTAAENRIREAQAGGAHFVCLPEAFNTGYYCKKIKDMALLAEPMGGDTVSRMRALAAELGIYILAPVILATEGGHAENAAILIDDTGKIVGTHSKTHMVGDERLYFQRGQDYDVIQTKYGRIGLLVCYDVCFPETARILALKGAEIILIPVACRDLSFYRDWLFNNLAARSIDNVLYVAAACMSGRELPESPFTGCSQFVGPRGAILAVAGVETEEILYHDIDLSILPQERMENTVLSDRHPEDYKILSDL